MVFQVRKYENSMEKYPHKVEVFEAWKQSFQTVHPIISSPVQPLSRIHS